MNTKLLTSVGCLLLLAAAMAPAVLGHDDRGDDTSFKAAADAEGVSGRYVSSAGPAIINGGDEIPVNEDPEVVIPSGPLATGGAMLCDMEVGGPGGAPVAAGNIPAPNDELTVDSNAGGEFQDAKIATKTVPGPVEDVNFGWDDGGHGGACHVKSYWYEDYNTAGCDEATAFARDDVNTNVFIGASCDWESQGGSSSDGGIVGLVTCLLNVAIQGGAGLDNCIAALIGLVTCLTAPATCPVEEGGDTCGGDGSSDGTTYGWGNTGVAYPSGGNTAEFGETFNTPDDDGDNCDPDADATASVFTFDAIDIQDLAGIGADDVYLAVAGDIVQV